MKIYASNWLINMGIVGFLRILKYSGVDITKLFNEDGSIELTEGLLDNFGHKYLTYSLYWYTKELIDNLPYSEDLKDQTKTAIASLEEALKDVETQLAEKPKNKDSLNKRKKQVTKTIEKLSKFPTEFNLLLNYYANLNLIANPSSKTSKRAESIDEEFVHPAIESLDGTQDNSQPLCSMCSRVRSKPLEKGKSIFSKSLFSPLGFSSESFIN